MLRQKAYNLKPGRIVTLLILGSILMGGASLRFQELWKNSLNYDECIWANLALNWQDSGTITRNVPGEARYCDHPPCWWYIMGYGLSTFGCNKFGLRFHALIMSLLIILLLYLCVRELCLKYELTGTLGALCAALMFAMNGIFISFSRSSQVELGVIFWGMFSLYLLLLGIRTHRSLWFLASAMLAVFGLTVKYLAVYYIVVSGLILIRHCWSTTNWRILFTWMCGVMIGGVTSLLFLMYLYSFEHLSEFILKSILFPLQRVDVAQSQLEYWRIMEYKEFIGRVYGWFHPIPLLSLIGLGVHLVEKGYRKMWKNAAPRSVVPNGHSLMLWSGIGWIAIISVLSPATRSIFYCSICMPVLTLYVGFQIQRISAFWFKCCTERIENRSKNRHRKGLNHTRMIVRIVTVLMLSLFVWFFHSAYLYEHKMYKKQRKKDQIVNFDLSELTGFYIKYRFPNENFFVSVGCGPQIAFISGFYYDQVYNVSDVKSFIKRAERTDLYIENGIIHSVPEQQKIKTYLEQNFLSEDLLPYLKCFRRKPGRKQHQLLSESRKK